MMGAGIYCIAFSNGITKLGRSGDVQKRIKSYRREIALTGGAEIAVVNCTNHKTAESVAIKLATQRYERRQRELFVGLTVESAKEILEAAAASSQCFIDPSTAGLNPRDPVSILAFNLLQLMAARSLSQMDLAKISGVDQTTIGRALRKANAMQIDKVQMLAKAFNMDTWQLLNPYMNISNTFVGEQPQ